MPAKVGSRPISASAPKVPRGCGRARGDQGHGEALTCESAQVVIATKFGFTFGPTGDQTGMDSRLRGDRLVLSTPCRPERLHRGRGGSGAGPDPGRGGEELW